LTNAEILSIDSKVELHFGKYIYITGGFPTGYSATENKPIIFSLSGFTNPPTIAPTDPFHLVIFYEEGRNEVSLYSGQGLSITAEASSKLSM
jgi:hypothetical protein